MAGRNVDPLYIAFSVTTPIGTLPSAPLRTAVDVGDGTLEAVDLQIPPGHSGVTGIAFALGLQQVLPWANRLSWIIGDDLKETFDIGKRVTGAVTVVTYNAGAFAHTHYGRFRMRTADDSRSITSLRVVDLSGLGGAE